MNKTTSTKNILVRCPNWVGDIVMATPVFQCLSANYPHARIVACVRAYAQGVLKDAPGVDDIIPVEDKSIKGILDAASKIKAEAPDIAILLTNSFRSWLEVYLAKPNRIYGYSRGIRKIFFRDGLQPKKQNGQIVRLPMEEYYLDICRDMQLDVPASQKPMLGISPKLQTEGDTLLKEAGVDPDEMIIGLNPGASFGSSKCWPPRYFARLAENIQDKWSCQIVLFGSPAEHELAQKIMEKSSAQIVNTVPLNPGLERLKALINRCDLLITNDTGPRHYAVALGIPVVVMMGPTHPDYTAANLEKTEIVRIEVECGPCHKKTCPRDHRCMTDITPEMVLTKAEKLVP